MVDEEVQNEDDQAQENMNEEYKNLVDHEQKILGMGKIGMNNMKILIKRVFLLDLDITNPENWKTID